MDMHLLNGLGFEFDSEEEINIQAILNCMSQAEEDLYEEEYGYDAPLYNYEDYAEDF